MNQEKPHNNNYQHENKPQPNVYHDSVYMSASVDFGMIDVTNPLTCVNACLFSMNIPIS
jgi:hypothetical protein